jgi:hypothetical protein
MSGSSTPMEGEDTYPLHVPKRREAKPPSLLCSLNMLSVTAQGPVLVKGLVASRDPPLLSFGRKLLHPAPHREENREQHSYGSQYQ